MPVARRAINGRSAPQTPSQRARLPASHARFLLQSPLEQAQAARPLRWDCKPIYIDSCVRARRITSKQHGCWSEYTRHFERTHEPCVPTCVPVTCHLNHFSHQYSHDKHVGTHGLCVRSVGNVSQYILARAHAQGE